MIFFSRSACEIEGAFFAFAWEMSDLNVAGSSTRIGLLDAGIGRFPQEPRRCCWTCSRRGHELGWARCWSWWREGTQRWWRHTGELGGGATGELPVLVASDMKPGRSFWSVEEKDIIGIVVLNLIQSKPLNCLILYRMVFMKVKHRGSVRRNPLWGVREWNRDVLKMVIRKLLIIFLRGCLNDPW